MPEAFKKAGGIPARRGAGGLRPPLQGRRKKKRPACAPGTLEGFPKAGAIPCFLGASGRPRREGPQASPFIPHHRKKAWSRNGSKPFSFLFPVPAIFALSCPSKGSPCALSPASAEGAAFRRRALPVPRLFVKRPGRPAPRLSPYTPRRPS